MSALAFTDNFPGGMSVATTPALTNTCGGTVTGGTAGSTTLSLATGAIAAAGGTCAISVSVEVAPSGVFVNQTGTIASSLGTGSASNSATYIVGGLTKTFSPNSVGPADVARLTVTITNPSGTTALTGVQFSDTYPANVTNTATPGVTNTCGGAVSGGAAGGNTIGVTGGTVAAGGTCSVGVNVSGSIIGTYYNLTGTIRANQGVGVDAADTLYVINKPTLTKSFAASTITVGGTSTMTVVVNNNHTAGITLLAFSDTFPAGMQVAATPALTNSCGGTVTGATAGSTALSLASGAIATANGSCTITVAVTTTGAGLFSNTTSGATTSQTGTTSPGPVSNTAVLTVNLAVPNVAKSFSPATVATNASSTLTITLTNPNTSAVTGVNFTDTYP